MLKVGDAMIMEVLVVINEKQRLDRLAKRFDLFTLPHTSALVLKKSSQSESDLENQRVFGTCRQIAVAISEL